MANAARIIVPEVRWELTTSRVLTIERIHGIKISEIEELKAEGHDLKNISHCLLYTSKISADGKAKVVFDAEEKHIVAMVKSANGDLFVGAGDSGAIYKISNDKGKQFVTPVSYTHLDVYKRQDSH